ncbi:uncharacterized protein LOC142530430 [Primulina tabacum]|uniref:uncharacterized protein LOC142530430 n=1 Tax=Primulina tabacum TaxID=48773 RepID=UPI003F5A69B3
MNKLEASLEELVNLLTSYETTIKKEKPVFLVGFSSGKIRARKGRERDVLHIQRKIQTLLKGPQIPTIEDICFHYKNTGRWKPNCKKYIAQKGSGKDMFFIEVNVSIN